MYRVQSTRKLDSMLVIERSTKSSVFTLCEDQYIIRRTFVNVAGIRGNSPPVTSITDSVDCLYAVVKTVLHTLYAVVKTLCKEQCLHIPAVAQTANILALLPPSTSGVSRGQRRQSTPPITVRPCSDRPDRARKRWGPNESRGPITARRWRSTVRKFEV